MKLVTERAQQRIEAKENGMKEPTPLPGPSKPLRPKDKPQKKKLMIQTLLDGCEKPLIGKCLSLLWSTYVFL